MEHQCIRCGTHRSMFWWPYGSGCDSQGNGALTVFEFCDDCHIDFCGFVGRGEL